MAIHNEHFFQPSLFDFDLILQKSHMPETFCRTFNDRKRKFVDTELAQDTEGKQMSMQSILPDHPGPNNSACLFTNQSLCSTDLFQDLSQLQEIWIAEGTSTASLG